MYSALVYGGLNLGEDDWLWIQEVINVYMKKGAPPAAFKEAEAAAHLLKNLLRPRTTVVQSLIASFGAWGLNRCTKDGVPWATHYWTSFQSGSRLGYGTETSLVLLRRSLLGERRQSHPVMGPRNVKEHFLLYHPTCSVRLSAETWSMWQSSTCSLVAPSLWNALSRVTRLVSTVFPPHPRGPEKTPYFFKP